MIPLILRSPTIDSANAYIEKFSEAHGIASSNIYRIYPDSKEISIQQIKEIKKRVVFQFNQSQLYVIYDFDKASYEAQNALLKTLEEHLANIIFILVVKDHSRLLPTINSRSKVIKVGEDSFVLQSAYKNELTNFLKSPQLKILSHPSFQVSKKNPLEIFDQMVLFFKSELPNDKKAYKPLAEIIKSRYLVENNNIDPQLAIDHLLIFIYNLYKLN